MRIFKKNKKVITHVRDDNILTFSTLDVRVEEDDNFGGGVLEAHVTAGLGTHSLRASQDSNLGVPPEVLVQRLPKMFCKYKCVDVYDHTAPKISCLAKVLRLQNVRKRQDVEQA